MDALTANGTTTLQTSVTGVTAGKRKFIEDRRDQPFDKRLRFSVRQTESAYRYRDIVVRKQDGFTHILLSTKSSENNSLNPEVSAAAGAVGLPSPGPQAKPPFPWALHPARPPQARSSYEQGGQGAPSPCLLAKSPPSARVRAWASLKSHVTCALTPPPRAPRALGSGEVKAPRGPALQKLTPPSFPSASSATWNGASAAVIPTRLLLVVK